MDAVQTRFGRGTVVGFRPEDGVYEVSARPQRRGRGASDYLRECGVRYLATPGKFLLPHIARRGFVRRASFSFGGFLGGWSRYAVA